MTAISGKGTVGVDIRVQDYLNDKLQTAADLDNLDSLLQNVQQQHQLLQVQVRVIFLPPETYKLTAHSSKKPLASSRTLKAHPYSTMLDCGRRRSNSMNDRQT